MINVKIKFRAENGLCPYFIYKNLKFFIQDSKNGKDYEYTCYVKKVDTKTIQFTSEEEANNYVKKKRNIRFIGRADEKVLYSSAFVEYVICKNKVTERAAPRPITDTFANYIDCLNEAKKKVLEYIDMLEPQQISLF